MFGNIESRFGSLADEYIKKTGGVLIGLSGGVDSVVLLHLLCDYCKSKNIPLYALHVNHMIRSNEAKRDEEFCKNLCEILSVRFTSVCVDVPAEAAKRKLGLEETARILRYDALNIEREKIGADYIALAHNSNDNLETVIFNLARGSGSAGMCGIPPVRDRIIRPLISSSKKDITDYAAEKGYDFVYDSTNADTDYTRNRIRAEIIPILRSINENVPDAAYRMSILQRADNEYLDSIARKYINEENTVILAALDDVILSRVIKFKAKAVYSDITYYHIKELTDLLKKSVIESKRYPFISLPNKVYASIKNGRLTFSNELETQEEYAEPYFSELFFGVNTLPSGCGLLYIAKNENDDSIKDLKETYFLSAEHIIDMKDYTEKLFVRTRMPTDTIYIRGMSRKIKKIFNEMKIPEEKRCIYPIICTENDIVCIPGYEVSDKYKNKNVRIHLYYLNERTK